MKQTSCTEGEQEDSLSPPPPSLVPYLDPVTHVVQHVVVDGLAYVAHGPLDVGRRDDLVGARRVLVGGQDADLPTGHLLLVDVHRLSGHRVRSQKASLSCQNTQ